MGNNLKQRTFSSLVWAYAEQFGGQVLGLIISIILARILLPSEFGLIAMIMVIFDVGKSLVDSGFGQSLIRKQDADDLDFSSVFWINLGVSVVLTSLIYFSAPLVADFFSEPELTAIVRAMSVLLVINAFSMVQKARLTQKMDFKAQTKITLPSVLISGTVALTMAYWGFGVWSLVSNILIGQAVLSVLFWKLSDWKPSFSFSLDRIKPLFAFGYKLTLNGLLVTVFNNIYNIVIGKFYTATQLGFYNRADRTKDIPVKNISNALNRVTYPMLSEIQDQPEILQRVYKKLIKYVLLIMTPVMLGGLALAEPLFRFVYTEKWLPAVPYFQWLCISALFYPVSAYNLNILKVKGRSDLYLILGIAKKLIEATGLIIVTGYSVYALVVYRTLYSVLAYGINSVYSGKFLDYNLLEQFRDIYKILLSGSVMAVLLYQGLNMVAGYSDLFVIIIGTITGTVIYGGIMYLVDKALLLDAYDVIKSEISRKLKKKK